MRNTYNTFGELARIATASGPDQWLAENRYYDHRGQLAAQVDCDGYLTTYNHDAFGNQTECWEYAKAIGIADGPISNQPPTGEAANDDRYTERFKINPSQHNVGLNT